MIERMSMPDTREQIISQAIKASHYTLSPDTRHIVMGVADSAVRMTTKAVTDRVRSAIDKVVFDLSFDDRTLVVAVDDLLPALDQIDAELGGK